MRDSLRTYAFAALILAGSGIATATGAVARSPAPAAPAADIQTWDGIGNDVGTGPHVGWSWRAAGDPSTTAPLTATDPAVNGLNGAAATDGFTADVPGLDGSTSEIYTIGGKLLGSDTAIAPREPTGPWAVLAKMTLKGVPAPATWGLILIGFVLIAIALRGLLKANRNLARLRAQDED